MTYPYETVTLRARDLFSKFGFGDGEMIDEILWDTELESRARDAVPGSDFNIEDETLFAVIERFLLPALPVPVRLARMDTHHNPARVHGDDERHEEAITGVEVTVRVDWIIAIARDIASRKPPTQEA